jgi:hypothetical protein
MKSYSDTVRGFCLFLVDKGMPTNVHALTREHIEIYISVQLELPTETAAIRFGDHIGASGAVIERRRTTGVIGRSTRYSKQLPGARHAFELVLAPVFELDPRANHEVLDRSRDKHFSGFGECCKSRPDVNRHPGDIVTTKLDFARVHSGSCLDAECAHRFACGARTADSTARTVEGGQHTITR